MELFSHILLHIEDMFFWLEIFFAIEINLPSEYKDIWINFGNINVDVKMNSDVSRSPGNAIAVFLCCVFIK